MPDSLARSIVDEALALQRERPELPALALLDLVMRGRHGTGPDFGDLAAAPADCLVDPSSPFGALLAAAFDEQVTFTGLRSLATASAPTAFEAFWFERVMRAFSRRYQLHPPV
jgi:hypothetical protein